MSKRCAATCFSAKRILWLIAFVHWIFSNGKNAWDSQHCYTKNETLLKRIEPIYPKLKANKKIKIENLSFSILFSILLVTLDRLVRFSWVKSHFERNSVGYLLHFCRFEIFDESKVISQKTTGVETGAEVAAHRWKQFTGFHTQQSHIYFWL